MAIRSSGVVLLLFVAIATHECFASRCKDSLCPAGTRHSDQCYEGVTNCVPCPVNTHSVGLTSHTERCVVTTSCERPFMTVVVEGDASQNRVCGCEEGYELHLNSHSCLQVSDLGDLDGKNGGLTECSKDLNIILISLVGFLILALLFVVFIWVLFCYGYKHFCWATAEESPHDNEVTEKKRSLIDSAVIAPTSEDV